MEDTLRPKIEAILADLEERQKMLQKSIAEYKEAKEWEFAMKCDIKARTFSLVEERIREALT